MSAICKLTVFAVFLSLPIAVSEFYINVYIIVTFSYLFKVRNSLSQ